MSLDDVRVDALRRLPGGWGVVWDGYRRQLVASHPDESTGLRIHGATVDELVARVDRYRAGQRFQLEVPPEATEPEAG